VKQIILIYLLNNNITSYMKICFIANTSSLHVYRWIKYFADKGYEVHCLSLAPNRFDEIKNVKFYLLRNFGKKTLNIFLNIISIRRLIKKIKPDLLHIHYVGVNGVLGAFAGFHPFILSAWGSDIFFASKRKTARPLIKYALMKADLIACNGEFLKEEIKKLGVGPQKIKLAYWATDTQKFKPAITDKKLRKELKILNASTIMSLRNLEPIYDVETLIKAAPPILEEFPEARFIIGGRGSERENLEKLSFDLGVSESIKFIGWIDYDKLPQYLNSADVYVSTSLSDGDLSQSTQQAMACQIPIITTDLAVNKKRIRDGENGLIFQKKDYKILAKKIIKLLRDKKLRNKLGEKGRKTILKELDFNKNMAKVEKIYSDLIEKYKKESYEKQ